MNDQRNIVREPQEITSPDQLERLAHNLSERDTLHRVAVHGLEDKTIRDLVFAELKSMEAVYNAVEASLRLADVSVKSR